MSETFTAPTVRQQCIVIGLRNAHLQVSFKEKSGLLLFLEFDGFKSQ